MTNVKRIVLLAILAGCVGVNAEEAPPPYDESLMDEYEMPDYGVIYGYDVTDWLLAADDWPPPDDFDIVPNESLSPIPMSPEMSKTIIFTTDYWLIEALVPTIFVPPPLQSSVLVVEPFFSSWLPTPVWSAYWQGWVPVLIPNL